MSKWDELTMAEKAEMIGVAVRNGITSLKDIRQKYNEFAEGGNIYSGDEEETQQMEVSRSPHVDLAISNPWLYQKLHPVSKEKEVYEPSTFAGRVAQLAGVDELGQKYTDYTSSTIQQFPVVGTAISAADLGYDLNRLYHNPSLTTTKDVTLDAASLVPALRKTMKGWWMKGNSGSFITETGQIINNPRVASTLEVALQPYRTAINTGVYGARAADFLDDSKAYLKEMYNSSKIGKHFPIKALGGPLVEAAMNEYKKGGSIQIKPSHRGRLTELKKRTGKTEAELYRTGGPSVRKMITFARNSRKWKHGLGGNLFYPGGYVRSTNDHPVAFDEEGNLVDQVTGETGTMKIPEIMVTGRDLTKPYYTSFNGSTGPYVELFGALSKGMQPLSLSQHVGAAADATQGKRNYFDSLFNGNSGFFSDEYAAEHPWISTLGNMAGDIGTSSLATRTLSKLPVYLRLEKNYTGIPHEPIVDDYGRILKDEFGTIRYKKEEFPFNYNNIETWATESPDHARTFTRENGDIFQVFTDPYELNGNILEAPRLGKDYYAWYSALPFRTEYGKVKLANDVFAFEKKS